MKLTLSITIEVPDNAVITTGPDNSLKVDISPVAELRSDTLPECTVKVEPIPVPDRKPMPERVEDMIKIKPGVKPLPGKKCEVCGNRFQPKGPEKCCSDKCKRIYKNNYEKEWYHNHKAKQEPKKQPETIHVPLDKPKETAAVQPENIKPEPINHRTVVLKSGERLCMHCKEPFKIEKFEQHFCSDSCEVLHHKKGK